MRSWRPGYPERRHGRVLNRAAAAAVPGGLPVYQVPGMIRAARAVFSRAFGEADPVTSDGRPQRPAFSMGRMFLGTAPGRVRSRLDVPYHTVTTGDGRSFTFRFDQWSPAGHGPHPVLVRIHGVGWISGG